MLKNVVWIAVGAMFFAVVGVAMYRLQGPGEPVMNPLGVLSFSSLGACLASLIVSPESGSDWWK
jgi:hypothetical protein